MTSPGARLPTLSPCSRWPGRSPRAPRTSPSRTHPRARDARRSATDDPRVGLGDRTQTRRRRPRRGRAARRRTSAPGPACRRRLAEPLPTTRCPAAICRHRGGTSPRTTEPRRLQRREYSTAIASAARQSIARGTPASRSSPRTRVSLPPRRVRAGARRRRRRGGPVRA